MSYTIVVADSFIVLPNFNYFIFTARYKVLAFSLVLFQLDLVYINTYLVMANALTSPSSEPSIILMAVPSKISQ